MPLEPTQVRRFAALFHGYQRAYGNSTVARVDESGKHVGKNATIHKEVVPLLYERHLLGQGPTLGIIPLMEDDTCCFGAIDYDNRAADHAKAETAVHDNSLPLIVCRSKSGGIHFYCFLSEPVSGRTLRAKLSEWAAILGMSPKTEIFPKQVGRANADDVGTYINLPYYAGTEATERYAVINGQPATLDQFLEYAESHKATLQRVVDADEVESELFEEGPPCLQILESQGGFQEGTRNVGMTAVAVYLRKRFPGDWQTRVDRYNEVMANLTSAEVQDVVKHYSKKEYNYSCKLEPLASHCNRRACIKRLYGIGEAGGTEHVGHQLGNITRYDAGGRMKEPMWALEVDGRRVMVNTSQLYSRDEFNRACMAQANTVPVFMSPAKWLKTLAEIIPHADIVVTPTEASKTGQMWELVQQFAFGKELGDDPQQVFIGNPYREGDKVYFRAFDLFRWLDAHRFSYGTQAWVYQELREHDAEHVQRTVGKKFVNLWCLPYVSASEESAKTEVDTAQTEEF